MSHNEGLNQLSGQIFAYSRLNRHLRYLLAVIFLVFITGTFVYAGEFRFWDDALSYLGKIYPVNGQSNTLSFIIFSSGMIASSVLCLRMSMIINSYREHIYYRISAAGFILIAIPTDFINILHTLGGALVVGSFWFYTLRKLIELFGKVKKSRVVLYHFILHGTVIPYAILYASGTGIRQGAQKIAVLGLVIMLKVSIIEYLQYLKKQKETEIHT